MGVNVLETNEVILEFMWMKKKKIFNRFSGKWGGRKKKHWLNIFIDSKTFKNFKLYILEWREYDNQ